MSEKLNWDQIQKQFDREWIELIDYDWDETKPYPSGGVVRVHSKQRKEFDRLILEDSPEDSAFVFVGKRNRPDNVVLNFNMRKHTPHNENV